MRLLPSPLAHAMMFAIRANVPLVTSIDLLYLRMTFHTRGSWDLLAGPSNDRRAGRVLNYHDTILLAPFLMHE